MEDLEEDKRKGADRLMRLHNRAVETNFMDYIPFAMKNYPPRQRGYKYNYNLPNVRKGYLRGLGDNIKSLIMKKYLLENINNEPKKQQISNLI